MFIIKSKDKKLKRDKKIKEVKFMNNTDMLNNVKNMLEKLDGDLRVNIYIGITAIFFAIVIFIAEIVSNEKIETFKNMILKKTRIITNTVIVIVSLIIMWLSSLVDKDSSILYIWVQVLVNILVIISAILTIRTLVESIRINTNKNYTKKSLNEYIFSKIEKFNRDKERDKDKRKIHEKNEQLSKYIKNNQIFQSNDFSYVFNEGYKRLYSNKKGYIYSYNYSVLDKITNKQIKTIINNSETTKESNNEQPTIYLCKKVGDYCDGSSIVAFYKNIDDGLIKSVNRAIKVETKKYESQNSEISKIIEDIFTIAEDNLFDLESYNRIITLYKIICEKNDDFLLTTFIDIIYRMYVKYAEDKELNKEFTRILIHLSTISFENNKYNEFEKINYYITGLYLARIKDSINDLKTVAYEYANNIFSYNYFFVKKKSNYKYIDVIMANLLIIIKELLKLKDIESVQIIFNNIYSENRYKFDDKENDEINIIKFQFLFAMIYLILYLYKIEENYKNEKEYNDNIAKILDMLSFKFSGFYDIWNTILIFKQSLSLKTEIMHFIEMIDFDNEDHRYNNSWTPIRVDSEEVLKVIIYVYNLSRYNTPNKEDVKIEDRAFYESILRVLKNSSFPELEKKFDYEKNEKESAINLLEYIMNIIDEKEKEYEKYAELDYGKIDKFKEDLLSNSLKKSDMEKLLSDIGKIKESDEKLKIVFGFSELIPRNWFIKTKNIVKTFITQSYSGQFRKEIDKDVLDYLEQEGKESTQTLLNMISEIKELDDYILISNRNFFLDSKYEVEGDFIIIKNKRIRTIFLAGIENFILVKKEALPCIELCKFDDSYNTNNVIGHFYLEISDCSNNPTLRNKIIKNNEWLKEKGNIAEQDEYLKTKCSFRFFKSYKLVPSENKKIYIINRFK